MSEYGFFLMRPVETLPSDLESPCVLWAGAVNKQTGYGIVRFDGKAVRVHRLAYFQAYGYWPNECRHRCDVRRCFNPTHLLDGTRSDNMWDMTVRGRNKVAVLNQKKADEIIKLLLASELSVKEIANQFGVSAATVYDIKLGRTWTRGVRLT